MCIRVRISIQLFLFLTLSKQERTTLDGILHYAIEAREDGFEFWSLFSY